MKELLKIYVHNSREVYMDIEWLQNCVAKRMKKNKFVTWEHLAYCSTMKKIMRNAARVQRANEGFRPSMAERERESIALAKEIFDGARYLAEQ